MCFQQKAEDRICGDKKDALQQAFRTRQPPTKEFIESVGNDTTKREDCVVWIKSCSQPLYMSRSVHAEKQQTKKPQRRPQKSTTSWNYAFCWKETASWTAVRNVRPLRNASTQAAAMRSARNGSIKKELDRQFEGQELLYWHDVVLVKRCCAMVITITKLVCLYVIQKTFME